MHDNLIPEFDFPIYKSGEEVSLERDSILQALKPYFVSDAGIGDQKIAEFHHVFPTIWSQFVEKNSLDTLFSEIDINEMEVP